MNQIEHIPLICETICGCTYVLELMGVLVTWLMIAFVDDICGFDCMTFAPAEMYDFQK